MAIDWLPALRILGERPIDELSVEDVNEAVAAAGDDVINFFMSTVSDGADVHSIRANYP